MMENQRGYGRKWYYGSLGIKDTTPQCWTCKAPVVRKFKRPLFSYRGKVWITIAVGLALFWIGAAQVISELTYQIQ